MKVIFFGTPDFASRILKNLIDSAVQIVGIVTRPDSPKKRSKQPTASEVKQLAVSLLPGVPIFQPEKCSTIISELQALSPDLFVVVAFGEIITQAVLDIPRYGSINLHPSALPKYRGAAPMQRALMAGEVETSVCVIKMVKKMDAGAILSEKVIVLENDSTLEDLENIVVKKGTEALLETIDDIAKNQVTEREQNEEDVTFAHKIMPEECLIDWSKPCQVIHNQIRGLSPKPGAYTFVIIRDEKKRIKILRSRVLECDVNDPKRFTVDCSDGVLELLEVQLEGKGVMTMRDFLKGTPKDLAKIVQN